MKDKSKEIELQTECRRAHIRLLAVIDRAVFGETPILL